MCRMTKITIKQRCPQGRGPEALGGVEEIPPTEVPAGTGTGDQGGFVMNALDGLNAVTLIFVALCVFAIGYRFYGVFIANRVLRLAEGRPMPAVIQADGMAYVFSSIPFLENLMAYWYHFAIMFGAVFMLTAVDAGYLNITGNCLPKGNNVPAVLSFIIMALMVIVFVITFNRKRPRRCNCTTRSEVQQ